MSSKALANFHWPPNTRPAILGTDWWTDCDDVMAVRLLCNLQKLGVFHILGLCLDACMPYSVRSLDGFLRDNGVDVPVGIDREATDFDGVPRYYQHYLAAGLPSKYAGNEAAEEGVRLYRRLLAASREKVTLMEIGFPQVLANLLQSHPDDLSPLDGASLVASKVEHLWIMAGKWDEQGGEEHNFINNGRSRAGGAYLCAHWPTPITFLGFEVGYTVFSGGQRILPPGDPLLGAMTEHRSANGRESWDPMLVLLAGLADPALAGYRAVTGFATCDADTGANFFREDPAGPHRYVVKLHEDDYYTQAVNSLLPKLP